MGLQERDADLEQGFYIANAGFVVHKNDHVIFGLYACINVWNNNFARSNDGTDTSTRRKRDFSHALADYLRRVSIAVCNGFDGFGFAAS